MQDPFFISARHCPCRWVTVVFVDARKYTIAIVPSRLQHSRPRCCHSIAAASTGRLCHRAHSRPRSPRLLVMHLVSLSPSSSSPPCSSPSPPYQHWQIQWQAGLQYVLQCWQNFHSPQVTQVPQCWTDASCSHVIEHEVHVCLDTAGRTDGTSRRRHYRSRDPARPRKCNFDRNVFRLFHNAPLWRAVNIAVDLASRTALSCQTS